MYLVCVLGKYAEAATHFELLIQSQTRCGLLPLKAWAPNPARTMSHLRSPVSRTRLDSLPRER